MEDELFYDFPSKEELDSRRQDIKALPEDDYVAWIPKIDLEYKNAYSKLTKRYDGELEPSWTVYLSIIQTKVGEELTDIEGNKVAKAERFTFRDINPFSIGFKIDGTSSILRGFVWGCLNLVSPNDKPRLPMVLFDNKSKEIIDDPNIRRKHLESKFGTVVSPYQDAPDIRGLIGKFVCCRLNVKEYKDKSGASRSRNGITSFSRLPKSFVSLTDEELAKPRELFTSFYLKLQEYKNKYTPVSTKDDLPFGNSEVDEIVKENIEF